ncbi:hypothetical protein BS50DRAFT_571506 [Corynespora cassiicola Philippines]|uniref:C2H2-type domain-containing protein n=1 Tax=Corynespora cassiicola Philippines TaxID=1448308 RepID=A0A2T2NXR6_CORCC|nr:hypothetical protein BS50DRAFT_571506 [Corynespora cassiicola Philippines]
MYRRDGDFANDPLPTEHAYITPTPAYHLPDHDVSPLDAGGSDAPPYHTRHSSHGWLSLEMPHTAGQPLDPNVHDSYMNNTCTYRPCSPWCWTGQETGDRQQDAQECQQVLDSSQSMWSDVAYGNSLQSIWPSMGYGDSQVASMSLPVLSQDESTTVSTLSGSWYDDMSSSEYSMSSSYPTQHDWNTSTQSDIDFTQPSGSRRQWMDDSIHLDAHRPKSMSLPDYGDCYSPGGGYINPSDLDASPMPMPEEIESTNAQFQPPRPFPCRPKRSRKRAFSSSRKTFGPEAELDQHVRAQERMAGAGYRCTAESFDKYACSSCDKTFSHKADLSRHVRTQHQMAGEGYRCTAESCPKLGKVWNRLDSFRQHLQKLHKDEDQKELLEKSIRGATGLVISVTTQNTFNRDKSLAMSQM